MLRRLVVRWQVDGWWLLHCRLDVCNGLLRRSRLCERNVLLLHGRLLREHHWLNESDGLLLHVRLEDCDRLHDSNGLLLLNDLLLRGLRCDLDLHHDLATVARRVSLLLLLRAPDCDLLSDQSPLVVLYRLRILRVAGVVTPGRSHVLALRVDPVEHWW